MSSQHRQRNWILFAMFSIELFGCTTPSALPDSREVVSRSTKDSVIAPIVETTKTEDRYEMVVLANGLKIYFVNDNSLPRLSIRALVKSGSASDPIGKEGLANLTADLLEMGAGPWNATELSEKIADIGSDLSIVTGKEESAIGLDCLDKDRSQMIEIFKTVLVKPNFNEQEIKRAKSSISAIIKKREDHPDAVANDQIEKMIFGDQHPYGRSSLGQVKSLKAITRRDIISYYFRNYRANNMILAVAGNLDTNVKNEVKNAFKDLPKKDLPANEFPKAPEVKKQSVQLLSKSGLEQVQIRIAKSAVTRQYPDYLAYKIATEILGGGFQSRLNSRIRDQLGLTYSIDAELDSKRQAGTLLISTFTKPTSVFQTTEETLKVLENFYQKGITKSELEDAKAQLLGHFPRLIETADSYAMNVVTLDFYDVNLNYLKNYTENLKALTLEQVNAVIKKEFNPTDLKILIYGDKRKIKDQVASLEALTTK